jgi:hypothetical protein
MLLLQGAAAWLLLWVQLGCKRPRRDAVATGGVCCCCWRQAAALLLARSTAGTPA